MITWQWKCICQDTGGGSTYPTLPYFHWRWGWESVGEPTLIKTPKLSSVCFFNCIFVTTASFLLTTHPLSGPFGGGGGTAPQNVCARPCFSIHIKIWEKETNIALHTHTHTHIYYLIIRIDLWLFIFDFFYLLIMLYFNIYVYVLNLCIKYMCTIYFRYTLHCDCICVWFCIIVVT